MGVLPLQFEAGTSARDLNLKGTEIFDINGLTGDLSPRMTLTCRITFADGGVREVPLLSRIDTEDELSYYKNGGILHYVLRNMLKSV